MGYGGWMAPQVPPPIPEEVPASTDPFKNPLSPTPPKTYRVLEDRVAWVLNVMTPDEHALLYRLLHESKRCRLSTCRTQEAAAKKRLDG